jgi:hypothetical protein
VRRAWPVLAVLACVRVAIPLAQLAHADLPGLPRYRWDGLSGDATGFYAAAREFIAAWGRIPKPLLALLALATVAYVAWLFRSWRRRPALRPWLVPLTLFAFGLLAAANIHWQDPSGAAVFGWPLVWALPLLPLRMLGLLDENAAFAVGVVIQLACNVVTLVAVAYAGLHASGRRSVGVAAAALWALWPFLAGLLAGHSAWANGSWAIDAGLHMYTEPLSTALGATALALVLAPQATPMRLAVAGCALSLATFVKDSNALVAGLALLLLAWRFRGDLRRVLPFLAGAVSLVPPVAVYWRLGYPQLYDNPSSWPEHPFALGHLRRSWGDSLVFDGRTLAVLVPLAVVGALALRRPWPLAVVAGWTLVNAVFYSFYANTAQHPRFLYASLPPLFVLIGGLTALRRRPA